jgi:hypothetical protein
MLSMHLDLARICARRPSRLSKAAKNSGLARFIVDALSI